MANSTPEDAAFQETINRIKSYSKKIDELGGGITKSFNNI